MVLVVGDGARVHTLLLGLGQLVGWDPVSGQAPVRGYRIKSEAILIRPALP